MSLVAILSFAGAKVQRKNETQQESMKEMDFFSVY
jgi:hypothetical protein